MATIPAKKVHASQPKSILSVYLLCISKYFGMSQTPDYQQDLASIRHLMERSVKFISLSGLAGVMAGLYALAGAVVTYYFLYLDDAYKTAEDYREDPNLVIYLALVAVAVLVLSLSTGWYLSFKKAQRANIAMWTDTTRRLIINLLIPLAAGGIFIAVLAFRGHYGIIAPSFLLFYGLALVNASSNLFDEFRYLGYIEIILGLVAAVLPGYGLYFWALGFGVLHIFYGVLMHRRYDRG